MIRLSLSLRCFIHKDVGRAINKSRHPQGVVVYRVEPINLRFARCRGLVPSELKFSEPLVWPRPETPNGYRGHPRSITHPRRVQKHSPIFHRTTCKHTNRPTLSLSPLQHRNSCNYEFPGLNTTDLGNTLLDPFGWGSKFWTTKFRNTEISKFQSCEYSIVLLSNLFLHFLDIIWILKIFNNFSNC